VYTSKRLGIWKYPCDTKPFPYHFRYHNQNIPYPFMSGRSYHRGEGRTWKGSKVRCRILSILTRTRWHAMSFQIWSIARVTDEIAWPCSSSSVPPASNPRESWKRSHNLLDTRFIDRCYVPTLEIRHQYGCQHQKNLHASYFYFFPFCSLKRNKIETIRVKRGYK